ncbi:serine/threonine dehydratase [Arenimonas maotaiensis]|uniref:Serine/threonine dehydratase n=1 Tax=Arenimonas maotaiensis TaxID=1446479 RepID=A0A917CQ97_9GAMM|nr:pyridoxal-phosphate dependent enzyme [Arenimonas maotaiensis]GGF95018.1 serine/threonine dehydratase [Arenimonas maotaiensis]
MIHYDDILAAAARIAPYAVNTPVKSSAALDALAGATLLFKCENLQVGGAFKFRGACNAVFALSDAQAARGVVTHSSGNHGAALARAAKLRGIAAHVVVPEGAVQSKLDAIRDAGAIVHRCAPTQAAREQTARELVEKLGATLVHPYEDPLVMAGQGTAALELLAQAPALDAVLAPVGGGGLISGTAIALDPVDVPLYGVEPDGAADTVASLAAKERITHIVPDTLCDGLRAVVGVPNFAIIREHVLQVLTVSDAQCVAAQALAAEHLGMVIEPSSATVLAAVLAYPDLFKGKRLGLILTGGNV